MPSHYVDDKSWLPDPTMQSAAGTTGGKKPCINCGIGSREFVHPYIPTAGRGVAPDGKRLCLSCYVSIEAAPTMMRIKEICRE